MKHLRKWLPLNAWIFSVHALAAEPVLRIDDPALLSRGHELFLEHCAICHGENAEGTVADWQQPDASGRLPPPPLNGSAHTWHHSINGLARTIREGTIPLGGSMPAWNGKLSDDDIFAIIVWFSSLWPDELYNTWMRMNRAEAVN
jgi:mono/diheme cytochrome c family protein